MLSGKLLLKQPAVLMFLDALGIEADSLKEPDMFHLACEQANPRYKGGQDLVRFQLGTDATQWPKSVHYATQILAEKLGMLYGEKRLDGDFDIVAALGGARRSPLQRALYAVEAIVRGDAGAKILAIAGSTRPLQDAEKKQDYAPGAETEIDLCTGAADFISKKYPEIRITAVCNPDPKSGNDGVIKRVMEEFGDICNGDPLSFAAVTTKIYCTGLLFDLARNNKEQEYHWRHFAAAGHPSDPEMVSGRSISTYLAEVLTTVDKASEAARFGC